MGGKCREGVPCYANCWFAGAKEPEEFAAKATAAVELGFKGLKWDPFGKNYRQLPQAIGVFTRLRRSASARIVSGMTGSSTQ